jgi:hypothetical protein
LIKSKYRKKRNIKKKLKKFIKIWKGKWKKKRDRNAIYIILYKAIVECIQIRISIVKFNLKQITAERETKRERE